MCKEMKWADGQIDIRKPYFMRLLSFLPYLYFYISLFICISIAGFRYRGCGITSQILHPLPIPQPTPKKAKRQKSNRT